MSEITKKIVNENEYMFINRSRGNRSGFIHETELFKNGVLIERNRIQYYNRTWECYRFQSVMRGLVYELINECMEKFTDAWKTEHEVKRLTAAKKEIMMNDLKNNPPTDYSELKELYSLL